MSRRADPRSLGEQWSAWGTSPEFLAFLVLLALKLTGQIDWSWWWVAAPIWIVFLVQVVAGAAHEVSGWPRRPARRSGVRRG